MSYFLAQGAIVSVPDYEGRHSAFTVGPQAARGTLNSIRAVLSSGSFTSISPSASTVMWGYSGGALASEWAGELHKSYAPELKIIGAAIGGFPTNISKTALAVEGKDNAGIAAASILGIAGTFPDFDKYLKAHIRPESSSVFYLPRTLCNWDQTDPSYGYLPSLRNQSIATFFDNGLTFLTDFAPLIDSVGTMGHYGTPTFPLFVWKGTKDQIAVPIEDTDALVAKYCAEGTNIAYQRYVGAKHVQAGGLGAGPAIRFLLGLLGGATPPKKCSITDIQVSK